MSDGNLYFGIDLGTTNSVAAVFDGEQVQVVRSAQGSPLTPSVVRIDNKGALQVGQRARRMLEHDPGNTHSEFKRLMGTAQKLTFAASAQTRGPVALSAEVLKSLREDAREQLGFAPTGVVVSVPALFELPQSSATSEAARLAGFERVELIQEPIAAALAAGWRAEAGSGSWMVYDLGGGTFDVSLLETENGFLRVIDHDGDNFLGGRDFDHALLDHVLETLSAQTGLSLERGDPALAPVVRKLKVAIEEAKIELTRAQTAPVLLPALMINGQPVDVEIELTRALVEERCAHLVERTLAMCGDLLDRRSLAPGSLTRVVLVGGATAMPLVRERLSAMFGAAVSTNHDPMTLVARGAALFAASTGLHARPARSAQVSESDALQRMWLQYPPVTSDLTPFVVGRMVTPERCPVRTLRLTRDDGWTSPAVSLDDEGAFAISAEILPRCSHTFTFVAQDAEGNVVAVDPARVTIVQGTTLGDPPLGRSIGIALADGTVSTYFERGTPLPARRTFRHTLVDTLIQGEQASLLRIPLVQGEYDRAQLCRLVGMLEVRGDQLHQTVASGAEVEVTLELDRGGRLSSRAMVISTRQVFEQIAELLVPEPSREALDAGLVATRAWMVKLRTTAFRTGAAQHVAQLSRAELSLSDVSRDIDVARGGVDDAAQRACRGLLEVDALLERIAQEYTRTALAEEAMDVLCTANHWMTQCGSKAERRLFEDAAERLEEARRNSDTLELQRRLRQVRQLGNAAYRRHPDVWKYAFESAAANVPSMADLPAAEALAARGRKALAEGDEETVREVTRSLYNLAPPTPQQRLASHNSSVR